MGRIVVSFASSLESTAALVGMLKMREWKMEEQIARVENAGVENTGAITYGKLSKQKTLKIGPTRSVC